MARTDAEREVAAERLAVLRRDLAEHAHRYYVLDDPVIADNSEILGGRGRQPAFPGPDILGEEVL